MGSIQHCRFVDILTLTIIILVQVSANGTKTKTARSLQDKYYVHTIQGKSETCLKCPPGYFMTSHCTAQDHQAKCESCKEGTYQSEYNVASHCATCKESCKTDREILVRNCSRTTNNYCLCKPGHYRFRGSEGLCVKHEPCIAGMGVKEIGTPNSDTVCEVCKPGFFSPNVSWTQICQPCSKCPQGFKPKEQCLKDSDTVCVPENESEKLPLILGIVCGVVVTILLVVMICIIVCCRRNKQFRKRFRRLCGGDNYDDGDSSPEKTPLSHRESPKSHNGLSNGDMIDKPGDQNGFVSEDPPGVVSDKILKDLSHDLIFPNWAFFFRNLFDESADIYICEAQEDNRTVLEQIYKLLKKWKALQKENAKMDKIVKALRDTDQNDLATKYSQHRSTDV